MIDDVHLNRFNPMVADAASPQTSLFARMSRPVSPLRLTHRLVIMMVLAVTLTTLTAALAAYRVMRAEFDTQINHRITDTQRFSSGIIQLEAANLEYLLSLAAQRPTLARLMTQQDSAAMEDYLTEFRADTPLDFLYVTNTTGEIMAGQPSADGDHPGLLTVRKPVGTLGYVHGGLNLEFALNHRLVSPEDFQFVFLREAAAIAPQVLVDGQVYYQRVNDLPEIANLTARELLLQFPAAEILAGESRVIAVLFLSAFVVAFVGVILSGLYIRRLVHPLSELTLAAQTLGSGNLKLPINVQARTPDIRTLAATLEQSRISLANTLEELAWSRDWAYTLIQSIHEGIVTYDRQSRVTFFSSGAAQITEYAVEAAQQQSLSALFSPDFADSIPPVGHTSPVSAQTSSGRRIMLSVTRVRPTVDGEATIVLRDITEEAYHKNLQAYFLANISHEFRTPLSGLKVSLELLSENLTRLSGHEVRELLNSLLLSTTSLQNFIDNLLESSKIASNHFKLRCQPTDLKHVLGEALHLMQPLLNRRQQKVLLELPLSPTQLKADPPRLTQVLVNLLSNASKYSPVASTITIVVRQAGAVWRIEVHDEGVGIPEQRRETIFQRFVRLEDTPGAVADHGSGLGLSVVRAIVEAHQGAVGVLPGHHHGTLFWFTLPRGEA